MAVGCLGAWMAPTRDGERPAAGGSSARPAEPAPHDLGDRSPWEQRWPVIKCLQ